MGLVIEYTSSQNTANTANVRSSLRATCMRTPDRGLRRLCYTKLKYLKMGITCMKTATFLNNQISFEIPGTHEL